MGKCLYCYKELKEGQVDYHPACAQKLYGTQAGSSSALCEKQNRGFCQASGQSPDYIDRCTGQIVA